MINNLRNTTLRSWWMELESACRVPIGQRRTLLALGVFQRALPSIAHSLLSHDVAERKWGKGYLVRLRLCLCCTDESICVWSSLRKGPQFHLVWNTAIMCNSGICSYKRRDISHHMFNFSGHQNDCDYNVAQYERTASIFNWGPLSGHSRWLGIYFICCLCGLTPK